jgi:hypothetical protein
MCLHCLQTLLIAKREENLQQKRRYEVGLQKLSSSSQQVAVMQAELTELMPKLIRGKKEKTSASAFMSDNTLRAGHSPIKCPLHLRQVLISGMCCSLCDPTHKHDTKSRSK